jgi:hypothetical protein
MGLPAMDWTRGRLNARRKGSKRGSSCWLCTRAGRSAQAAPAPRCYRDWCGRRALGALALTQWFGQGAPICGALHLQHFPPDAAHLVVRHRVPNPRMAMPFNCPPKPAEQSSQRDARSIGARCVGGEGAHWSLLSAALTRRAWRLAARKGTFLPPMCRSPRMNSRAGAGRLHKCRINALNRSA